MGCDKSGQTKRTKWFNRLRTNDEDAGKWWREKFKNSGCWILLAAKFPIPKWIPFDLCFFFAATAAITSQTLALPCAVPIVNFSLIRRWYFRFGIQIPSKLPIKNGCLRDHSHASNTKSFILCSFIRHHLAAAFAVDVRNGVGWHKRHEKRRS